MSAELAVVRDKEERRLAKIKIGVMRNPKFALWSGLMTVGKTAITDNAFVPTACTNGRDEFYGRKFVQSLDDKEFTFVVLHETLHKAYRHITTWRRLAEQDGQLCNLACDYVINIQLKDLDPNEQFMAMPTKDGKAIGFVDEKYRGMNTKQVFDLLKQDKEKGEGIFAEGEGDPNSMTTIGKVART